MRRVFLGICLAFAAPAHAQSGDPSPAVFRIGGVEISAPIPAGLCMPPGINADVAQILAAGDHDNVTHLSLFRCGEKPDEPDYVLVKTPTSALTARIGRAELLTAMGEEFEKPESVAAATSKEVIDKVGDTFTTMLNTKIDFNGTIRPFGKDEACAYMAGTFEVTAGQKIDRVSVAVCLTAVGDRVLSVNWYGPDRGVAGIAELARRAKAFAVSMRAEPAR